MSFKKEILLFIIAFWSICFFVGYQYSQPLKSIFNDKNSTLSGTPQASENIALQNIKPVIQQIDPTEMEVLSLETFSDIPQIDSLISYVPQINLSGCTQFDPTERTTVSNPQDLLAFVNKQHKIDGSYSPDDLVAIADYGIPTLGYIYIRKDAAEKFNELYIALTKDKLKITASSGWRSLTHQQKVLDNWTRMVGASKANNYAALP